VVSLESRPVPAPFTSEGLAAFTVYVGADSPVKAAAGELPTVEYRDVQAHSIDPSQADGSLASYKSLEVTLVHQEEYAAHIEKGPQCNANEKLFRPDSVHFKMHGVHFTGMKRETVQLQQTGTYFLLVSNCGNVTNAVISGNVAVRNPFGYVSGVDYHKLVVYGWLALGYVIMAAVWAGLCVVWRSELIAMHAVISIILVMCLVEACSWYFTLSSLNQTGIGSETWTCVLVMNSVMTEFTAYTFILVISQGWRMTEEILDDCLLFKMGVFGLVWVVANYMRQGAMTHRSFFHFSTKFMTITALPSMVLNVLIFGWVFSSLNSLTNNLKERGMSDKLQAVDRFTKGLTVSLIAGALVSLIQLLDNSGYISLGWQHQFMIDGGLGHVMFMAMLGLAMFAWKPSAGSGHLGYAAPHEQEEEGDAEAYGGKVAPQRVGATDDP
jgi:hypothetical protein